MKVVIAGGSGFIGRLLVKEFSSAGYEVVVLAREEHGVDGARVVPWDAFWVGEWKLELEGAKAVINLTGSPIGVLWGPTGKERILSSRVSSTQAIGRALAECDNPPEIWINSSASGFYGNRGDQQLIESDSAGVGFLPEICAAWERAVSDAPASATRRTRMRTGIVLGKGGGALPTLVKLVKRRLGGKVGNGRQFMPWIGVEDIARLYRFCVEHDCGPVVNACSPNPATNAQLMLALRQTLNVKFGLPASAILFRFAEWLFNFPADLALDSCRMAPKAALDRGFEFRAPDLRELLEQATLA